MGVLYLRIIEQVQADDISMADQFLIDGELGTRGISFENILNAIDNNIGPSSLWGGNMPVGARRNIFRGKNLGSEVTQERWNEIGVGTFKDLFIGDYWEINNVKWRIADIDYWWGTGSVPCEEHHLVIVPDFRLYNMQMNNTSDGVHVSGEVNTTVGAYIGSDMYKTGLNRAKNMIIDAFGAANILWHKNIFANGVINGHANSQAWYDSSVEIMCEPMVYGNHIFAPSGTGEIFVSKYTVDKTQLALFALCPNLINIDAAWWLRDVVTSRTFALVNRAGTAYADDSSWPLGVRPVFGIKKAS